MQTVQADARDFVLTRRFALCLMPMQTVQLLGGPTERLRCLRCVRAHLRAGGLAALAISEALEPFHPGPGVRLPLPDQRELEGVVYSSQPTAIRARANAFVLERRREIVELDGAHRTAEDRTELAALRAGELEREAERAGLRPRARRGIPATVDYVGSTVVILGA